MTKKLLTLLLVALFPATLFAEVRVPKFKSKTNVRRTQAQPIAPRTPVREGPITRGMQQGILRRMEVETSKVRIPATRSNPRFEFGRKFREQRESLQLFVRYMKKEEEMPLATRVKLSFRNAKITRDAGKFYWEEHKEKVSDHEFYLNIILKAMLLHGQFTAEQLVNLRAFYEKTISHPEVFTSDMAFADGLSASLHIGYVGDAYLAEKIFSLAKQAPEGKRFLTDFVVVRSLLNLERYDLVEELMNFRQGQEGWFQGEKFVGGETASVYEEVKLYQQTVKNIPVVFSEQLPARSKFTFSEKDKQIADLMRRRPHGVLFQDYLDQLTLELLPYPETSAEGLAWFLQYKHRDFFK